MRKLRLLCTTFKAEVYRETVAFSKSSRSFGANAGHDVNKEQAMKLVDTLTTHLCKNTLVCEVYPGLLRMAYNLLSSSLNVYCVTPETTISGLQ